MKNNTEVDKVIEKILSYMCNYYDVKMPKPQIVKLAKSKNFKAILKENLEEIITKKKGVAL